MNFSVKSVVAPVQSMQVDCAVPEKECRRVTLQLKKLRPERPSEPAELQSTGVNSSPRLYASPSGDHIDTEVHTADPGKAM